MTTAVQAASPHAVQGLSFDPTRVAERRKTLGASEIAAVAGVHPHNSAVAVWAEKRGLVPAFEGNHFSEWGLRLEGAIRQKYSEVIGRQIEVSDTIVDAKHPWRSCTPDGLPVGAQFGVEIKRFGEYRVDEFGATGSDEVPIDVAAQCHWSMDITGLPEWHVAALLGQADFRWFVLRRDDDIANSLFDAGHDFWFNYVQTGQEPPVDGSKAAHRYLAARYKAHSQVLLKPTPEQIELGRQLRGVKNQIAEMEFAASGLEAQLKAQIGESAGLVGVATWKAPRAGYVAWKAIVDELTERFDVPTDLLSTLVASNTNEPSRRFVLTMKES